VIATVLGELTGQLERRFLLNAFFPALLFTLALALSAAAGAGGVDAAINSWEEQDTFVQVLMVIGWVAGAFVLANLLANGIIFITRLFEGYTVPAGWFIARLARERQHKQAHALLTKATSGGEADRVVAEDRFQQSFPLDPRQLRRDDFAPTRLGNLLRSAESYSQDRYGVSAVRAWPRLYHLLPDTFVTSMADARASMEFLLVLSFLAAVYVPLAAIYLIISAAPLPWIYGSLVAGAVLALFAYRAALAPAAIFGSHIRTAFDLYRLKLLRSLNAPVPATPDEERRIWSEAIRFLDFGTPTTWRYVPAPPE
jgi:hypothetical protein